MHHHPSECLGKEFNPKKRPTGEGGNKQKKKKVKNAAGLGKIVKFALNAVAKVASALKDYNETTPQQPGGDSDTIVQITTTLVLYGLIEKGGST